MIFFQPATWSLFQSPGAFGQSELWTRSIRQNGTGEGKRRDIPLGSDEGAFGDDEAGTGSSLNIILQIDMIWHGGGN